MVELSESELVMKKHAISHNKSLDSFDSAKILYCIGILSIYSPFCVPAKVTKLVGLKNKGGLSPINLVTFAVTQNGE